MITLETVRAAALSDRPWDRLDELVRAEMAAGRKVAEIADEFIKMLDDVWETPGLSEDGNDAFGDTLDALTGNCGMESSCYKDPPNNTLPTEEEIANLPRWARVAFAARCARRVLPIYRRLIGKTNSGGITAGEAALLAAESSALMASADSTIVALSRTAQTEAMRDPTLAGGQAKYQAIMAASFAADAVTSERIMECVAKSAAAARAALKLRIWMNTVGPSHGVNSILTLANASDEVKQEVQLIQNIAGGFIRRDFDHLIRLAKWQHWTDHTRVSPELFGPLWPEGPPPGWPTDPDVPQRAELPVAFLALERVIPMVLEDEAVNVFNALNRYYIARTGDRLTLDGDIYTLVSALVGAGV